jgi:hypothetical protein
MTKPKGSVGTSMNRAGPIPSTPEERRCDARIDALYLKKPDAPVAMASPPKKHGRARRARRT